MNVLAPAILHLDSDRVAHFLLKQSVGRALPASRMRHAESLAEAHDFLLTYTCQALAQAPGTGFRPLVLVIDLTEDHEAGVHMAQQILANSDARLSGFVAVYFTSEQPLLPEYQAEVQAAFPAGTLQVELS